MIGGREQDGEGGLVLLHVLGNKLAVDAVVFLRTCGEREYFVPSRECSGHFGAESAYRGIAFAVPETRYEGSPVVMQVL